MRRPGPADGVASSPAAGPAVAAGVIRTDRLDLLPLRVSHAEEMAVVLCDPGLHAFTGGQPQAPDALRERYARLVAGPPDPSTSWLNWVIRVRAEDRLAGTVQATLTRTSGASGRSLAEIAWVVGTGWQGRGIATEAARGLVGWLAARPVDVVLAHVHPHHAASAAVAAAAGLRPTTDRLDGEVRWERALGRDAGR